MSSEKRSRRREERNTTGGRYPLQCFENSWYDSFFTYHDLIGKDDAPAVEEKQRLGGVEDKLEIFLQVSEGSGSPSEADEVKRYCGDVSLEDLESGIGEAGTGLRGWMDDRNSPKLMGCGNARLYDPSLTATGLLRQLKKKRYKNGEEPDAERRLIYIADLTPAFILALAVTSPYLQASALRDAICKHISFRPSIRVHIPSDGMPTFQLEFHLPFFALRKATMSDEPPRANEENGLRGSEPIYLLTRDKNNRAGQEKYHLHEAHMSCVVYGSDEWQWTAWAFEDTEHEPEDDNDVDISATIAGDELCQDINEDPIIIGHHANKPIWKPRQYFLKAFETRIKKVGEEWDNLARKLEVDQREYTRLHPFTSSSSSRSCQGRGEEMQVSFDWTRQRRDLLTKLIGVLSGLIQEWNTFISLDGDVGYLSDLDESPDSPGFRRPDHAGQSLRSIKYAFGRLENDRQTLELLKEALSSDLSTLKLCLSLEGNTATANSAFLSQFTVWVLFPWTLSSGLFSMQPEVIPFDLKPRWFLILVFILMAAMFVLYQLMMNWNSWGSNFMLWMKLRSFDGEAGEGTTQLLRRVYRHDIVSDIDVEEVGHDLESSGRALGTKAVLGRRDAM